jgi:twinkle protein|tara:strand:- start:6754 stop:8406 length:1653 start_codon:yes stop_codon:yes gene_type:complete
MEKSNWDKHNLPCPKCGGSDPVSTNEDGSGHCFSCGEHYGNYQASLDGNIVEMATHKEPSTFLNSYTGVFGALTDRNISETVAKKYGVRVVHDHEGKVSKHIYPYYNSNEIVSTKTRTVSTKGFTVNGGYEGTGLFGEQLFGGGGKYLTITEGECDAMAVYEIFDKKWASVSIKRGAQGAVRDVRDSIEFIESFDNVVICFDNDKYGREAARKVARIIKPGKAKIVSLPTGFKDANAFLEQGQYAQFTKAWWDAKTYTPSGIMELSSAKDKWLFREKKTSIAYPWEGLNKKLFGMRKGELVTLTGGTGLGKSSITRELCHYLIKNTPDNVGIIALEENWLKTADGLVSIEANDRLYLEEKREKYTDEQLTELFDRVIQKDKVYIHAHLGATDIDEIFSKLRYMIVGCECDWVVVDHLHMLVNQLTEMDERRGIDNLMNRLRSLVEETGVGMFLVSHLRRAAGEKGHEQGIEVSLSHLKGSQGISQLSDCVIALERNQQAEDSEEANTTKIRVLKSRYTGDTGLACSLRYNPDTGRMLEVSEDETLDDCPF